MRLEDIGCTPVVIIGAPRSGTNMLRDCLATLPQATTWPCDEINPIWRHGNRDHPTDELVPEQADHKTVNAIRRSFRRQAQKDRGYPFVIEKTCANSLRIPFVRAVLPEAKFIFVVRDGRDAAASAMQRWRANVDIPYLARKARYVPVSDLPYYGLRFMRNRLKRNSSREKQAPVWGPIFSDLPKAASKMPLSFTCAMQWAFCVLTSAKSLYRTGDRKVFRLTYEDFVSDPAGYLRDISSFLGMSPHPGAIYKASSGVTDKYVGSYKDKLTLRDLSHMESVWEIVPYESQCIVQAHENGE